ncbi:hypothetical protein WMY93_008062 [Mugilogobius chulae]|uniref:Large ribosomal subunit protein eL28 n=1 Tax=Mugilogobius chulae TaxID=88201 RepID=A0AAW0PJU6_9GOBI
MTSAVLLRILNTGFVKRFPVSSFLSSASRFSMSSHLQWMVIRNCSSFLIKRNGQTYSTEPNNLKSRNSFRFNGLVHKKTVGVQPAPDGKGVVVVLKKRAESDDSNYNKNYSNSMKRFLHYSNSMEQQCHSCSADAASAILKIRSPSYLCGSTALIPKLLDTFLFENRYIDYEACLSYMFFVLFFGSMQSWTLVVMSFDRKGIVIWEEAEPYRSELHGTSQRIFDREHAEPLHLKSLILSSRKESVSSVRKDCAPYQTLEISGYSVKHKAKTVQRNCR